MTDGELVARQYDRMADGYAADNEENVYNSLYERPATIDLLGDVSGLRILDVGCGAGPLTGWLVDHGAAAVTGMDASARMLDLARRRVGDRARLVLAGLEEPLAFQPDGSVDLVVASLVLHYVRDWEPVFHEFRRVLVPGGKVVFSTHHPAMDWRLHSPDDYFAIKQVSEVWTRDGLPFEVTFWRRPLTAMTAAVTSAGFVIERLVEPAPSPAVEQRDPRVGRRLVTTPHFLFFRLRAPTRPPGPAAGGTPSS